MIMQSRASKYYTFTKITLIFSLFVIMLGAYTRLSDAGLGCPDWPGCYGKLVLPEAQQKLVQAQQTFPQAPLVVSKAWTEMVHRYFAGMLGLLVLVLAFWGAVRRRHYEEQPLLVPWLLVGLVVFQAILGMWTVTLKLLPLVVMGHLMGGMLIASLLWWLTMAERKKSATHTYHLRVLKPWAIMALVIVLSQIFLGAWTSTNYAAMACPNFPFCHGSLFPNMDWQNAFNFTSPVGPSYEGGRLAMEARVTIQMAHRYGAFVTFAFLLPFAITLTMVREYGSLHLTGLTMMLLLLTQITLGVLNIELQLPMWTAMLHNLVAVLLLLSVMTVIFKLSSKNKSYLA